MQDYTFTLEEAETFILNYKINENKIIMKLASGEENTLLYTKENEIQILERMRSQVINSTDFKDTVDSCIEKGRTRLIVEGVVLTFAATLLFKYGFVNSDILLNVAFNAILTLLMIIEFRNLAICHRRKNDIEKNMYFIDNELLLNKNIKNKKILKGTKTPTKKLVKKAVTNPILNINNIESVPFSDLRLIKKNITKTNSSVFEEERVLILKRD